VTAPTVTGKDPALAGCPTALLLLRSPQWGDFTYALQLAASAPLPAPRCELAAPLGARHCVPVTFRHYSTAPGLYACAVTRGGEVFSVAPTVAVDGALDDAAAWEGALRTVAVTFEGVAVGATTGELVLVGAGPEPHGGDAGGGPHPQPQQPRITVPLVGACSAPQPAGPFELHAPPAAPLLLAFRNVFLDEREFVVACDRPDLFSVAPVGAVRVAAKAVLELSLQLRPPAGGTAALGPAAATGRLTVTAKPAAGGIPVAAWVYYLRASDSSAGAAVDAGAVGPAAAPPPPTATGKAKPAPASVVAAKLPAPAGKR